MLTHYKSSHQLQGKREIQHKECGWMSRVQILETEGYDWRELNDSDYDSEDSNAENNPLHDYPEEEDFGDPSEEESDKTHDSGDFDPDASDQDYDVATYNDQNNFQWSRRL
jgi:hypothetical protein